MQIFTPKDLVFAAFSRCRCGAGLAYAREHDLRKPFSNAWYCSSVLLDTSEQGYEVIKEGGLFGGRIMRGDDGVEHDGAYPFNVFEIKSENQPSAGGASTRNAKNGIYDFKVVGD